MTAATVAYREARNPVSLKNSILVSNSSGPVQNIVVNSA
jgi:hypothetical protein